MIKITLPCTLIVMSISTAKRFTIAEYHRIAELGFFGEDDLELIKGEIVQIAAKGTADSTLNRRLIRLSTLLGDRATLQRYREQFGELSK